ncbi:DUF4157 domain-containing protein [Streptomyces sp. NPDC059695]|uniref:eCIS core domain-containing protein n=1 Tax=Streptomyces sp. NPDC059695 TaxID=3346910 RepID=UPI0036AD6C9D
MRIPAHGKDPADASKDSTSGARPTRRAEERPAAVSPRANPAADTLPALQRAVGNAAVARMLAQRRAAGAQEEESGPGAAGGGPSVHEVLRSPGRPLAEPLRAEMEGRLGSDFGDVRLHTGPVAQRSAEELGARAYTSGSHVVIGPGGADKHTLAHELTHVIQQRGGPVSGTDNGAGLRVSDPGDAFERAAEANAKRVMSGPAVQRAAHDGHDRTPGHDHRSGHGGGTGVVQRKGHEELGKGLPAGGPPAPSGGGGLMGRFKASFNRPQADPGGALVARVREGIRAYDQDPNRDAMHCLMVLTELQHVIAPEVEGAAGATAEFLTAALTAVDGELAVVRGQITRDDDLPDAAREPFRAMTEDGMLWNREEWADSAARFRMKGPSYFRELSEMNRAGMAKEIGQQSDAAWVSDVRTKLGAALRQSVLTHYTPRERAEQMLSLGHMKSKTELLKANPEAANNSEAYDKHVLANEGFVFFFLEVPGSPFRETRFGGSEPARIEIPLAASPLMSQGWLMLSDFAQREFPTLRARPDDPARTQSRLATRTDAFSPEYSRSVRSFDLGSARGGAKMDMDAMMDEMGSEQDADRRGLVPLVMGQALADEFSEMTYGDGAQAQVQEERLRSNTLMGTDIVPGLVERGIVEILRIEGVNPQLAARLKAMSGDELMRYLLKDLLRPQAMLPNTVDLSGARAVTASGRQLGVPVS